MAEEYETIWVNVYDGPLIRGMSTPELKEVFCNMPKEIAKRLFLSHQMEFASGAKKVRVGWGDGTKYVGRICNVMKSRKDGLQVQVYIKKSAYDQVKTKKYTARIDATKDVDTKKVTYHGILISY